eukprot:Polyplicarium_translucidae@DN2136_c0_g2_i1.p1
MRSILAAQAAVAAALAAVLFALLLRKERLRAGQTGVLTTDGTTAARIAETKHFAPLSMLPYLPLKWFHSDKSSTIVVPLDGDVQRIYSVLSAERLQEGSGIFTALHLTLGHKLIMSTNPPAATLLDSTGSELRLYDLRLPVEVSKELSLELSQQAISDPTSQEAANAALDLARYSASLGDPIEERRLCVLCNIFRDVDSVGKYTTDYTNTKLKHFSKLLEPPFGMYSPPPVELPYFRLPSLYW